MVRISVTFYGFKVDIKGLLSGTTPLNFQELKKIILTFSDHSIPKHLFRWIKPSSISSILWNWTWLSIGWQMKWLILTWSLIRWGHHISWINLFRIWCSWCLGWGWARRTLWLLSISKWTFTLLLNKMFIERVASILKDSSEVGGLYSENFPNLRSFLEFYHCTLPVELEVHYRTQEGTHSVRHLGLISRNPRTSYSQDLPF